MIRVGDVFVDDGGYGEVYKRMLEDGTIVAVKKFAIVSDDDVWRIESNKLSAVTAALQPYPHVATLVPRYISRCYEDLEMVMEYSDGVPFGNLTLTIPETGHVLLLMIDALASIQSVIPGFVHDDFHSFNVLVDASLTYVRIIDFHFAFQMPGSKPRIIPEIEDDKHFAFERGCDGSNATIHDICYMIFHTARQIRRKSKGDEIDNWWLTLASTISIKGDRWYVPDVCYTPKPDMSMDNIRYIIRHHTARICQ